MAAIKLCMCESGLSLKSIFNCFFSIDILDILGMKDVFLSGRM